MTATVTPSRRATPKVRVGAGAGLAPWLLLAPVLLLVIGLRVVPMLVALVMSFTDLDLGSPAGTTQFVGAANYQAVLNSVDFQEALWVTIAIVGPALALEMLIGLGIALWLDRETKTRRAVRMIVLFPYLFVPVVIGLFFRMFFNAQFGQLNYYLGLVGISPEAWLTNPVTVRWTVVAMEVWHTTPFVALLVLAGLAGIPREAIEAAMVDGANAWQRFRYVTLPSLLPVLGAVVVLRGMDALQLFDEVYVMTGGGPGRLTSVINMYLYQFGFRQFRLGETSAAVTIFVGALALVALIGLLIVRQRRRWVEVSGTR
ncbi:MAG: carbohydrate ABC transporter permease [Beutenbergiaceae bacterium]